MAPRKFWLLLPAMGLFLAWLLLLRPTFLGGPAGYVMVSGASMEPTFYTGDLVVTRQQPEYGAGDVVAFRAEGGIVIHRIVGGSAEEGFVTQGDNKKGPDPWTPRPESIVGKQWLHVAGAGRVVAYLRQPLHLGLVVGGLTIFSLLGGGAARRRKGGRRMPSGTVDKTGRGLPAPAWVLVALGVLALLGLGLAAGAVYSFRQPAEKSQLVERLRYEHTAAFDYTVHVQPSTLYSDEVIGPITAPPVGATAPVTPTLYTKLARSLDLGFNYALKSPHPLDVGGELSAVLQVQAENGWRKTLELLPPAPFAGPTASFRTGVDLAQVLSLIETIEKETGFNAGSYQLAVIPTVHVRGQIDGNLVEETYAPPFTMKLNRTQITPASPLTDSQVKTLADKVTLEQGFPLPGLWLPVMTARWLSGLGAALTLFATVVLAVVVFLGLGRGEVQKVRARYGSLLVSVAQADLKEDGQRIQVASMRDLARLAERDGRIIFDQKLGPESHLYFIQDGEVTYQYAVAPPAEEVNLAT